MARKTYRYSLDSRDAKNAGVCSTIGKRIGIDPTFVRIAWVAVPVLTPVTFVHAFLLYAAVGIWLTIQRKREVDRGHHRSEFERMDDSVQVRPTVKAMRELGETDRKLMAIDHHIHSQNEELAREIEALKEEK